MFHYSASPSYNYAAPHWQQGAASIRRSIGGGNYKPPKAVLKINICRNNAQNFTQLPRCGTLRHTSHSSW